MELIQDGPATHTGVEHYVVTFDVPDTGDDAYDTQGAYVNFTVRPRSIRLCWERSRGQDWRLIAKRVGQFGQSGSYIRGFRVLGNGRLSDKQDSRLDVLNTRHRLTPYARSLPGLEDAVRRITAVLPK